MDDVAYGALVVVGVIVALVLRISLNTWVAQRAGERRYRRQLKRDFELRYGLGEEKPPHWWRKEW